MGHYSNAPYVSYPEVGRYRRLSSEDKELWRIKLEKELKRSRRETTLQKIVWDYDFRRWNSVTDVFVNLCRNRNEVEYVGAMSLFDL